jgi:zinc transporter 1/2/3
LESRAEHLFEAVFDSLAAGTFLYVCTMDVLADSFEDEGSRLLKVILATTGFGLMAVIALWT